MCTIQLLTSLVNASQSTPFGQRAGGGARKYSLLVKTWQTGIEMGIAAPGSDTALLLGHNHLAEVN